MIQDAKHRKATVHISWFDLADAYGSVIHQLIEFCLRHYHVPESLIRYIMDLYSKLWGRVRTSKCWVTELFDFCRGIFTGDNYSPIIFNVIFQPLIDFLNTKKESQGHKLGATRQEKLE